MGVEVVKVFMDDEVFEVLVVDGKLIKCLFVEVNFFIYFIGFKFDFWELVF